MDINCVINDVKTGKSYKKLIDGSSLSGRTIGETVPGSLFGLAGYDLQIRGGSDTAGFPLKQELHGGGRKKMLLKKGDVGVHLKRKGAIIRKTVRGNAVNNYTVQVNLKIIKYGIKGVAELLGRMEEKKEEASQQAEKSAEEKKATKEAPPKPAEQPAQEEIPPQKQKL